MSEILEIDADTVLIDGADIAFDAPALGIQVSQLAIVSLTDFSSGVNVRVTQLAIVTLIGSKLNLRNPPIVRLPCQTNCITLFDQRK